LGANATGDMLCGSHSVRQPFNAAAKCPEKLLNLAGFGWTNAPGCRYQLGSCHR
jgi:hypothetical protein